VRHWPLTVVEQAMPSATAAAHVPVAPASLVLHLPPALQGAYWLFSELHGPPSGETEMVSHCLVLLLQTRFAS
jgi:hypothetical protein